MKRFLSILSTCVLGVVLCTANAAAPVHYIDPTTVDLRQLLPNPPADDSAETKREIATVLREQLKRTPADVARALAEDDYQPSIYADVLGPKFTEQRLPITFALLRAVTNNAREVSNTAKSTWNRPRPPQADSRVKPAIPVPANASYPSGHAIRGHLGALVLAELFPEKRSALIERGWLVGWDRVIGGVHYPSDIAAGFKLGEILGQQFLASDAFKADLEKARGEGKAVFGEP